MTTVAQIGNLDPPHSTENELRKALCGIGCEVRTYQEGDPAAWSRLRDEIAEADFVLWTRTASELNNIPALVQEEVIGRAKSAGIPVVGYHLDIWFGLRRAHEISSVPYFKLVDIMCTADGGHDVEFAAAGVNHVWFPPGVSEFECGLGEPSDEFRAPLGFVGSWGGEYHQEWRHRHDLVRHLKRKGCRFWPEPGQPAVRGVPLRTLYASVDVAVGDSCLVTPRSYWSDRIPETLGRGGVLVHPRVDGLEEHFKIGTELEVWNVGDWDELDRCVRELQHDPDRRASMRGAAVKRVLADHTYTVRMRQLIELLNSGGYL